MRSLLGLTIAHVAVSALPSEMVAWQRSGTPCEGPGWDCISEKTVSVPTPLLHHALIEVKGASLNPYDKDFTEPDKVPWCKYLGLCAKGTIGIDGAGVVVSTGPFCNLQVGDEVYGKVHGSYAQYALVDCGEVALKPKNLDFVDAAVIPGVGASSLECLQKLGLPSSQKDLTVVVTSGQGGTGSMAVQLAKAMGATKVITAATGAGIEYTTKLGADVVVDYHKQDLWDFLGNDSVDLVFDNLGKEGTADMAMPAIRSGGKYIVLFGGSGGRTSKHPKEGVEQIQFGMYKATTEAMQQLASFFEDGLLQPITGAAYGFDDVKAAWNARHVLGKIAIVPSNTTVMV